MPRVSKDYNKAISCSVTLSKDIDTWVEVMAKKQKVSRASFLRGIVTKAYTKWLEEMYGR